MRVIQNIRQYIKNQRKNDTICWRLIVFAHNKLGRNRLRIRGKNNITQISGALLRKVSLTVVGHDNIIILKSGASLSNVRIFVRGSHNKLIVGRFSIYSGEILFDDDKCTIEINDFTTVEGAHMAASEPNSCIKIGYDCMFGQEIQVRTGDSHSIIDTTTKKRINYGGNVVIGDHVWLAADVKVLKGVSIGSNSVIATGSIVTKSIPENVIAGGIPAAVIRNSITWDRMRIRD